MVAQELMDTAQAVAVEWSALLLVLPQAEATLPLEMEQTTLALELALRAARELPTQEAVAAAVHGMER
jgi:hypothetical protein